MGEPVYFALSERNQREKNQDALYAARVEDYAVFGVADGLGGHAHGEVAAGKAIAEIREISGGRIFTSRPSDLLSHAFEAANHRIMSYNQENRVNSATTLVAAIVHAGGKCTIANCGDSRASTSWRSALSSAGSAAASHRRSRAWTRRRRSSDPPTRKSGTAITPHR